MKGDIGLQRKIIGGNRHYSLTSICCIYKEKIVKNDSTHWRTFVHSKIQKVATLDSDRKIINLIQNKSFRYYNL